MNKYIVQLKGFERWIDTWRTDTLKQARKYCKTCIKKGYKARVVKEM